MLELLQNRRSTRKFTSQPVDEEATIKLLSAGLLAPTSKDTRSTEFLAVTDRATIDALAACKDYGSMPLQTATLAIAVVADTRKTDVWVEDAAIAAVLMQLEAESLGLGSTWVQMRLRSNAGNDAGANVRQVLALPEYYGVLCVLAVGHKDEQKPPHQVAPADWKRVRREKF